MVHLSVEWFDGKYPSFNLHMASKEGSTPFMTIRGCRIVTTGKGEFVSYPAQKNEKTGKWWNHCQGSDRFNDEVLVLAKEKQPKSRDNRDSNHKSNKDDHDDIEVPF
jgi:hypothetical protein